VTPRETHERSLSERKKAIDELEARASRIATARLVVFFAIVALVGAIAWAHLPPVAWAGVAAAVLVFVGLVVVHARVHEQKDQRLAAARFHERAIARMAGKWRAWPSTGERWAIDTHPYAGDLDVFGRASLFQLLDATSTRYGEEVLARWLSADEPEAPVKGGGKRSFADAVRERQAAVKDLAPRLALREELAVVGSLLDETKPDPRPFVMWAGQAGAGKEGRLPSWLRLVAVALPVATIGTAVAASLGLVPRATFFVPYVACFVALTALRGRLAPILVAASSKEAALSRYGGMLALLEKEDVKAKSLEALKARLRESGSSATKEMAALSRIVGFLDANENGVFRFVIGPMLMWDLWCALALDAWRARAGRAAFGWFRALAELEALSSLAGFAFERPDHVFPEIVEEPTFAAEALGHPLIEADKRVANDVAIEGPGNALVVTGSNMSGKSTLLRAIGVNVVLANAGAPVCAKKLRLGRLRVATSMRVSDSLEEGTSRFYAELKKLKLVLDLARQAKKKEGAEGHVLFLLDEILHGTNTRERLIGARAILKELLAQGALGAVSTHDLGLGDLENEMPGRVRNVHFEEQVNGDVMTFDYRLREGVVQSSNALRLMKIVGLDVIAPA
jgi:energy-coupling factor transporter ATP-binding protein EcfA2